MPNALFNQHRLDVLQQLDADEAVLLFASSPVVRTGTSTYRYRPDSDFYWLTGWEAPEAVAFLRPGERPFTLFVQPRDAAREQWDGTRAGPEGAVELYGADVSHPIEELLDELPKLLRGVRKLHFNFGRNTDRDAIVLGAIRKAAQNARKTFDDVPETFLSYGVLLHELRLFKNTDELTLMREAARITADAHLAAGGHVIGVYPDETFSRDVSHLGLSELHRVSSMHERKATMYELSDAVIALPGGYGTLEELFEALTWTQIGLHALPAALLDVGGFWDPFVAFLDGCVEAGFLKEANRALLGVASSPTEALSALERADTTYREKWSG